MKKSTILLMSLMTLAAATCPSTLSSCNGQCYSASQNSCTNDLVTNSLVLCVVGYQACNGACFSPASYHCANGGLKAGAATAAKTSTTKSTTTAAHPTTTAAAHPTTTTAAHPSTTKAATTAAAVVTPPAASPTQYPTQTADLRIINNCKTTLWFEARYGSAGAPLPGQTVTAIEALPGGYVDYVVPDTGLAGSRFWAKYGCDSTGKNCIIGDQMQYWPNPPGGCPTGGCTPPIDSLFEATWGCRPGTSCNAANPTTWFDTSQVDGWTIPYTVTPLGDTSGCDCSGTSCGFSGVNATTLDVAKCPSTENLSIGGEYPTVTSNGATVSLTSVDLRVISNGQIIGCMSPCKRLNWASPYGLGQSESTASALWMCCPTPTPSSCTPSGGCVTSAACRAGPVATTKYVTDVHTMAPGVYSYAYDDGVGLHACPAGVTKYTMTFCPAGSAAYPGTA